MAGKLNVVTGYLAKLVQSKNTSSLVVNNISYKLRRNVTVPEGALNKLVQITTSAKGKDVEAIHLIHTETAADRNVIAQRKERVSLVCALLQREEMKYVDVKSLSQLLESTADLVRRGRPHEEAAETVLTKWVQHNC
ncbi:hypothetical protein DIPPA_20936 [Diplonema papillatum]|nr:hypothetical protein DIPPA_20936 [Diplonema papillatum]